MILTVILCIYVAVSIIFMKQENNDIMKYNYCYVMDYSNASIIEFELTETEKEQILNNEDESVIYGRGYNSDVCEWMYTVTKIDIVPYVRPKD